MLFTQKSYFSKTMDFIICCYWIFRHCNSSKFLTLTILVLTSIFRIYIISKAYKIFIKQWHALAVQVFTMSFSIYIVMLQVGKHTISAIITNLTKWQWRFYISSHVVELFRIISFTRVSFVWLDRCRWFHIIPGMTISSSFDSSCYRLDVDIYVIHPLIVLGID